MEIYPRSNHRHSRAGGNPVLLDSRLRGNDVQLFHAACLNVADLAKRPPEFR